MQRGNFRMLLLLLTGLMVWNAPSRAMALDCLVLPFVAELREQLAGELAGQVVPGLEPVGRVLPLDADLAIVVHCPGAVALRFRLVNGDGQPLTPEQCATISAQSMSGTSTRETNRQLFTSPSANGWTQTIAGDTFRLHRSVGPGDDWRIAEVAVIWDRSFPGGEATSASVAATGNARSSQTRVGDCHPDASCFPEHDDLTTGIAMFTFNRSGVVYRCTGQLLATRQNDGAPYFLTANHCVADDRVAQTVNAFWFYKTDSCDGTPPPLWRLQQTVGAFIVDSVDEHRGNDFSLLFVESQLPTGVRPVSWSLRDLTVAEPCFSLHHPDGSHLRLAQGERAASNSSFFSYVTWIAGATETGSSGAGLYNRAGELVGQLFGGTSSCNNPRGTDVFGKFTATYSRIAEYLRGDPYEDNDSPLQAADIAPGTSTHLTVTVADPDWYRVTLHPGESLQVRIEYLSTRGDIYLELFRSGENTPFLSSRTGAGNARRIGYVHQGAPETFLLHTALYNNAGGVYTLHVEVVDATAATATPPTIPTITPTMTPPPFTTPTVPDWGRIALAGYQETMTSLGPSEMLLAYVSTTTGQVPLPMELYYSGLPTGVRMTPVAGSSGLYQWSFPAISVEQGAQLLLEIGPSASIPWASTVLWPYLNVASEGNLRSIR